MSWSETDGETGAETKGERQSCLLWMYTNNATTHPLTGLPYTETQTHTHTQPPFNLSHTCTQTWARARKHTQQIGKADLLVVKC